MRQRPTAPLDPDLQVASLRGQIREDQDEHEELLSLREQAAELVGGPPPLQPHAAPGPLPAVPPAPQEAGIG